MTDPTQVEGQTYQDQITIGTTTGNALPGRALQFIARMVVASNFTNQYVYIPQANDWIPPNTQGYRLMLSSGTRVAQANVTTTPTGAAQAATVAGQMCVLTWMEKPVITSSVTQQITAVSATSIDGTGINVAATPAAVAAADGVIAAAAAGLRYLGFSARETAAAAATGVIRHGAGVGDPIIEYINLAAGESAREYYGPEGIATPNGIYFDLTGGAMSVTVRHKTVA